MTKVAIDIALLPSEEIRDKAIRINKQLLKNNEKLIKLHKENCLPHISLSMGCVEKKNIPKIKKRLEKLAKEFSPNLKVTGMQVFVLPDGKKTSSFEIEKTKNLQKLHEEVMKELSPYMTYDVEVSMVRAPPKVEKFTLDWVNNYPQGSAFGKFFPHITLGFGEAKKIKLPIKFKATKLTVCHLGNYCTCRKILASVDLK